MSGMVNEGVLAGCQPVGASALARAVASETSILDAKLSQGVAATKTPSKSPSCMSTAPASPMCSPPSGPCSIEVGGVRFLRTISGCSTEPPETLLEHDDEEDIAYEALLEQPLPPLVSVEQVGGKSLDDQLAEVKELFRIKYGCDVDSEDEQEEADEEEGTRDEDGTRWITTTGTGPLTIDVLEDRLAEVKDLYEGAFGRDVDDDSEEEYGYDADGTAWVRTTGTGPLTVDLLEDRLAEVKDLYEGAFGRDVDDDSEEEYGYDADGTAWVRTTGTGPLNIDVLEDRLAEVKDLYRVAFGRDADEESEEYEYDADGTAWVKTVGAGPLTESTLEESLADVKALFQTMYGYDVDDSEDEPDAIYDEDGTPWIKTIGIGPLTVDVLEERLAEVKELYNGAFGRDADEESHDDYEYDADGTAWVKTVGSGPLTMSALEQSLEDVKALYKGAFGRDVDDDSEDEYEYDADGTPWVKTAGAGPLTILALEESLAEVKALFRSKYDQDVDEESIAGEPAAKYDEEYEYDADGTAWVKIVGKGPPTVSSLEQSLVDVKELFRIKYGYDVDDECSDIGEAVEIDEDDGVRLPVQDAAYMTSSSGCAIL